jgi:glycosyltransferase involved in cell wall biosynthesis
VRVAVLTTSYPRSENDIAGTFVRDAVETLRGAGVDVEVVAPARFRHFGIAYGDGIPNNLRARPWLVLLLPLFFLSFAVAARRAARDADVVYAHWLPSVIPALATRRPLVAQLWGSDVALAERARPLARLLLRRARVVVAASGSLAEQARGLGAREVAVVPTWIGVPAPNGEPDDPPHVLFVGRLSEEKGVHELVEATAGLPRVVVGDGPLRHLVPDARGFVPPSEVGPFYDRAAVVCVPSRREGYGIVAREAMAHGRPVVATAVGGLVDAVDDGVTGLLVRPGDAVALREALTGLLSDPDRRSAMGAAGREAIAARHGRDAVGEVLVDVLRRARA